jgi:O-methyltransferase domain/Dimerisation domain
MAEQVSISGPVIGGSEGGRLGQMLEGYLSSQVTSVMARLGVADRLAAGARTAAELAPEVDAAPDALGRLLAAAAVYGLVAKDAAGRFALTPMGELLRSDVPGSARGLAVGFLSPPMWASAGRLAEAVRHTGPAGRYLPTGPWEYFSQHPQEAHWFARAMGHITSALVSQLAAADYVPPPCERIVDVGGNRGTLLAHLLHTRPAAMGVLFDRSEAIAAAPAFLAGAGVSGRVALAEGDFLREVPEGDMYVLCQVLHNWEDDGVRRIAGNCHRASYPGGSLLVIEQILPSTPEPSIAHLMDLLMLMLVGGRERSREQHTSLLGSVGYTFVRDTPVTDVLPWHVLEFRRT